MKPDAHLTALTDPSVIERLTGARPVPKLPAARDFVRAYADAISAARQNGWRVDEIHAELEAAGVQIEIHTLRKYVSELCGPIRQRRKIRGKSQNGAVPLTEVIVVDQDSDHVRQRSLRRSLAGKA